MQDHTHTHTLTLLSLLVLSACELAPVAAAPAALEEAECDRHGPPPAPEPRAVRVETRGAPVLGEASAPVEVVVFSDFECPFCRRGAEVAAKLVAKYPGKVRVTFKHDPLPFHEHAERAALAAIAAGKQGKFWELHDRLFFAGLGLDDAALLEHAKAAGLDVARFLADLSDASTRAILDADLAEARRLEVKGTPTFFVNGKRLVGVQPMETFEGLL